MIVSSRQYHSIESPSKLGLKSAPPQPNNEPLHKAHVAIWRPYQHAKYQRANRGLATKAQSLVLSTYCIR